MVGSGYHVDRRSCGSATSGCWGGCVWVPHFSATVLEARQFVLSVAQPSGTARHGKERGTESSEGSRDSGRLGCGKRRRSEDEEHICLRLPSATSAEVVMLEEEGSFCGLGK